MLFFIIDGKAMRKKNQPKNHSTSRSHKYTLVIERRSGREIAEISENIIEK
jgi:hypothetical protein